MAISVTGLVSGLDTKAIISSLLSLERQPLVQLQQQQSRLQAVGDAFRSIISALGGLRQSLQPLTTLDANPTTAAAQITAFVSAFNTVLDRIQTATAYNPQTRQAGPLLGESLVQDIPTRLFALATSPVPGLNGPIRSLADIGIVVGAPVNGQVRLQIDQTKLTQALQTNPQAVQALFTGPNGLVSTLSGYLDTLIGPGGLLPARVSGIDRQLADLSRRIAFFQDVLTRRQKFLEAQFTQMELALARLRQQQGALGGLLTTLLAGPGSTPGL